MKEAYFERFTIELPDDAVESCHHQGSCDGEVEYWQTKIDLSHIPDEKLAAELKEYGCWDSDELKSRIDNERRIIWIAAGNIQDENDSQQ